MKARTKGWQEVVVMNKLEPGDILVCINNRGDLYSRIKRWALGGPYEHVFLYLGKVYITSYMVKPIPMIFESMGKGVCLRLLSERYGQKVVVMRLKPEYRSKIPTVLREAVRLASDEKSYYDYSIITTHIIPQLILEKLHLPIPLQYQRNSAMVCSEACAEIFWRANLNILPKDVVPLPEDFVTDSPLLEEMWRGYLDVRT